jgi:hypothetical protein
MEETFKILLIAALQQTWLQESGSSNSKAMIAVTDKSLAPGEPDHKYLKLTKKSNKSKKEYVSNIMLCDAENNLQ